MEKNSEYWEKRLASETWKTYNSLEEKNRELLEFYIDASESVKDELYRLAEKYSKDGVLSLDEEDVVVRGVTVTLHGESMWPPPEVKVSVSTHEEDKQETEKLTFTREVALCKALAEGFSGGFGCCFDYGFSCECCRSLHCVYACRCSGLLCYYQCYSYPAYSLNVGNQRHFRHHHRGCNSIDRIRQLSRADSFFYCYGNRGNKYFRWFYGYAAYAQDV